MATRCENYSYTGSASRGTAMAARCSRPAKYRVTVRRMGRRVDEVRCSWHRDAGMNCQPIEAPADIERAFHDAMGPGWDR